MNRFLEPLSIDTNLDENFQPMKQLNTPERTSYFNNEFTDELGFTVCRETVNYADANNLLIIKSSVNSLVSNEMYNVSNSSINNNTMDSVHQSSVVDITSNQARNDCEENESEDDSTDEDQEYTYSQVEGEKGRAIPFKKTPVVSEYIFF